MTKISRYPWYVQGLKLKNVTDLQDLAQFYLNMLEAEGFHQEIGVPITLFNI